MLVSIGAAIIIYSLFSIFSIFAAVQQINSANPASFINRRLAKKFSLFRHEQNKSILAITAQSLSLWGFAVVFLLTGLPDTMWLMNQKLSKFLSYKGFYENGDEIWTVMLPILSFYLFYEIHFHVFQWIAQPDSRAKCSFSFSAVDRAIICISGLYIVVKYILLEDIAKVLYLFTLVSIGKLLFPLVRYHYIIWAYPVWPLTDPWLCQETYAIAKRNKMAIEQILIVKYPCMEHKGIKCFFGNILIDSRILQWENGIAMEFSNPAKLNDSYVPTICQKEVKTMITHALGRWNNYHDFKVSLIWICQFASITATLVLSYLLSPEFGHPIHVDVDLDIYKEDETFAIRQERRLRTVCLGILVALLCFILPLIYAGHWFHNFYRQRLDMVADQFTQVNFQGQQLCKLLAKESLTELNEHAGHHWAYRILYPDHSTMIFERVDLLKKRLEKSIGK